MKTILPLAIGVVIFGGGSISAQTETSILYKRHTFEVAPEISYRTYNQLGLMKQKGMIYGLGVSYTYHNKIMLKAEGIGDVGWKHFSNSGPIDNVRDIRGLGGYDFRILKSSILTPYIGIGYRHLNDDFSGKPSTLYEKDSTNIYSPIGIGFVTGLGNDWSIGGTGEYDLFWWGKQTSHIPVTGFNDVKDVENRQKNGFDLRGSIAIERKYKKVIFEAGPFIRYLNIKKSETGTLMHYGTPVGTAWEPNNNSTEVGIRLAVKF
jgi:hypothetical protein